MLSQDNCYIVSAYRQRSATTPAAKGDLHLEIISLFDYAYTERGLEVLDFWWAVCGSNLGPLIKSGKWLMIRAARWCEGFPIYH